MLNNWRHNKAAKIGGIPIASFLPLLTLIYVHSMTLALIIIGVIVTYAILSRFGYTPKTFLLYIINKLRGSVVYARPWYMRSRWSGQNK